jgi:hypothetical protein
LYFEMIRVFSKCRVVSLYFHTFSKSSDQSMTNDGTFYPLFCSPSVPPIEPHPESCSRCYKTLRSLSACIIQNPKEQGAEMTLSCHCRSLKLTYFNTGRYYVQGILKGESITVQLTSCFDGLD